VADLVVVTPGVEDPRKAKLEAIKAKTKRRVGFLSTMGHDFYLVGPTRTQWHQFKDAAVDPKRKRAAMENLGAICCVDPTPNDVQAMFEDMPALAEWTAGCGDFHTMGGPQIAVLPVPLLRFGASCPPLWLRSSEHMSLLVIEVGPLIHELEIGMRVWPPSCGAR